MEITKPQTPRAWRWIPTLYFCEGVPNAVVVTLSVVMFKNLGLSNAALAYYTSWLYLPWVVKPLWSPVVELFGHKRRWIVTLQFAMGLAFGAIALALPFPGFVGPVLALLWLMAFCSATHDIAADGLYLDALPAHEQAAFVGVRNTCFRLATMAGKGGLVALAGALIGLTGGVARGWSLVFVLLAVFFGLSGVHHQRALPVPAEGSRERRDGRSVLKDFVEAFRSFFAKPGIGLTLFFLLVYRLAEALALKMVEPFLLDPRSAGGLGLTNEQLGLSYGFFGVVSLLLGGLLGGLLISRHGLRRMLWPMILAMHVPIGVFVLLARTQPENLALVGGALALEQFGYGFGFTAYMVWMMKVAEGAHRTAHYAICTGFMALGLMLPGLKAGWLQERLGYADFFLWVCVATLPSFAAAALLKIDPAYGRKA